MTGLDSNILIQLAVADHPGHRATQLTVQGEIDRGNALALTLAVIGEFLHVTTDARRFAPPLEMSQAMTWLENLLASREIVMINPDASSLRKALEWMRQFGLGRKRILDTLFAATLHTNGVDRLLTSNPADFSVFQAFDLIVP